MTQAMDPTIVTLIQQVLDRRSKIAVAAPDELQADVMKRANKNQLPTQLNQSTAAGIPTIPTPMFPTPTGMVPGAYPQNPAVPNPQLQNLLSEKFSQAVASDGTNGIMMVAAINYTSDTAIVLWLSSEMPKFVEKVKTTFGDNHGFNLIEVWDDIKVLSEYISDTARLGIPEVKGVEAKGLVTAIVEVLFNNYVAPKLSPITQIWVRRALPVVIQVAYETIMRKAAKTSAKTNTSTATK